MVCATCSSSLEVRVWELQRRVDLLMDLLATNPGGVSNFVADERQRVTARAEFIKRASDDKRFPTLGHRIYSVPGFTPIMVDDLAAREDGVVIVDYLTQPQNAHILDKLSKMLEAEAVRDELSRIERRLKLAVA